MGNVLGEVFFGSTEEAAVLGQGAMSKQGGGKLPVTVEVQWCGG